MVVTEQMPMTAEGLSANRWEHLGRIVHRRREELGLSKSEAARRAQVSATTWRLIEKGTHDNPTDTTLVRMAKVLRLEPGPFLKLVGREHQTTIDDGDDGLHLVLADMPVSTDADLTHDEAFVDALRANPRLDATARAFLLAAYQLMLERGR